MKSFRIQVSVFILLSLIFQDSVAQSVSIATGQVTGTYYKVGQALRNNDSTIEIISTNGSLENLKGVEQGKYDFGIAQSDILYDFLESKENQQIKTVGAIYREPVYIVVRNKLYLSSINELKNKKVAVGLTNSGTRYTSEIILGIFGLSLNELQTSALTYGEITNSLENESIDAAFIVNLTIPDQIKEIIKNKKAYCLKINKNDLIKIASARNDLYKLISVTDPLDDKKHFITISVTSVLITNSNTNRIIVLKLARQLREHSLSNSVYFENFEQYWVRYPFLIFNGFDNTNIFHETALDYYRNTNLIRKYKIHQITRFKFPVLFCLFLLLIIIFKKTRRYIKNDSRIWITYVLLVIIGVGNLALYCFESNAGNPEITGSPYDLCKMLSLVFQTGEIICITNIGQVIKVLILITSGIFIAAMTAKIAAYFVGQKILEVFNMIPNKNSLNNHIVICNWTSKIESVIRELRSDCIKKCAIVILTKPTPQTSHELPDIPEYDNVYIIVGNPADEKYLQRANIQNADSILILADTEHQENPDTVSLMILLSIRKVLSTNTNDQKKPNITVEALDPVFSAHMHEAGANEVIAYADIAHKLLAQAVITPGTIGFIREILTATDDSNEVYILEIPKEYEGVEFQEFASRIMNKHHTSENPITVIGIKSKSEIFINPKQDIYNKIHYGDEAVILAWIKPKSL